MAKKSLRVDAFVDESIRGQTYYLCAVLVPLEQQAELRNQLKKLALSSNQRRLHFHNESQKKKLEVLDTIGKNLGVILVQSQIQHDVREEDARQNCLSELIAQLQEDGIQRIFIESRSNNRDDELTILRVRSGGPTIDFVHLSPQEEALLWCADAIAWAYGSGQMWKSRISGLINQVIHAR